LISVVTSATKGLTLMLPDVVVTLGPVPAVVQTKRCPESEIRISMGSVWTR